MDRPITRRDFLDGIAMAIGGAVAGLPGAALAQGFSDEVSGRVTTRSGLQGQTDRSAYVMHAVRDGTYWENAGTPVDTGETYDLVVVGAGISGLSAAFLYRQQRPDARVLLIEPQEDFGGHAKRNEFLASNGQRLIGYGGSQSMQTPGWFSPAVKQVLADVGIEPQRFEGYYDQTWSEDRGLSSAIFFDGAKWGQDTLVVRNTETTEEWVSQTPLSDKAKADLIALIDNPQDYMPGMSREEKIELLSEITYRDFLLDHVKADPQLVDFYQTSTAGYFGAGIDAVTAMDARNNWNPGFDGMDLGEEVPRASSPSGRLSLTDPEPYIYHFPDGNAGIARALLRQLIPTALPGSTMEDLVVENVDYGLLDQPENDVRLRLGSTVVGVAHDGDPAIAEAVTITYADYGGQPRVVKAGHVVLACWHRVIPYLADELPAEQVEALNDQQKIPLMYVNVQLRNWEALANLGIDGARARGNFWHGYEIDFPVSMGSYRFADTPQDPVILHFSKVMLDGEGSARDQALAGRRALAMMPFSELEFSIRDLLQRSLEAGGFDAARDIEAITVNRWAHGYAYEYMRPWDAFWPDGPLPIETARQPWGRVSIANSDSGAYAYAHSAIDQAVRAVRELIGAPEGAPEFSRFPGPPTEEIGL
jgi:spermidine dehydrogenase